MQEVSGVYTSVFKHQFNKNGFLGPKSFQGFREMGPWSQLIYPLDSIIHLSNNLGLG